MNIDDTFAGAGEMSVLGLKGGTIKGSESRDLIHLSFCEDLNVDVDGGNSMFGLLGDRVEIAPVGNKNITVLKDSFDSLVDARENKANAQKPPVDLRKHD